MKEEAEILAIIKSLSGKQHPNEIFFDWVELAAISIRNNSNIINDDRYSVSEQKYISIAKKYTETQFEKFRELTALLIIALTHDCKDILGNVYMKQNYGSKATGQYFTPSEVTKVCSEIVNSQKTQTIYEPTCGSGGMIIETINKIKNKNPNWQKEIDVVASDVDIHSVHMCYVQLSLLGISATVFQGNALENKNQKGISQNLIFCTPRKMGWLI